MAHDHAHHHHGGSNIGTAFFLNLAFTVVEIIGGLYTGSIAVLSDALHDLGDSLSLGLSWYFQRLAERGQRNAAFTFGYKRFNTLGAVVTGLVLVGGSVYVLTEAIPALWNPTQPDARGMVYLAILGVLVNGAAVFKLRGGGDSLNEQVLTWHLLEDVLGWVAVLIGAIVMLYVDAPWIDPALSIAITVFILFGVVRRLWKAARVFLMASPEGIDYEGIRGAALAVDGVTDVHHLHLWTLDGSYHLASLHAVVDDRLQVADLYALKAKLRAALHELDVEHLTVEFETVNEARACGEGDL